MSAVELALWVAGYTVGATAMRAFTEWAGWEFVNDIGPGAGLMAVLFWPLLVPFVPGIVVARKVSAAKEAKRIQEAENAKLLKAAERELALDEVRSLPLDDRYRVASSMRDAGRIEWDDLSRVNEEVIREREAKRRR